MFILNMLKGGGKSIIALMALGVMLTIVSGMLRVCNGVSDSLTSNAPQSKEPARVFIEVQETCDTQQEMKDRIKREDTFRDKKGNTWAYCGYRYYMLTSVNEFHAYKSCLRHTTVNDDSKLKVDSWLNSICEKAGGRLKLIQPDVGNYQWGVQ